MNDKIQKARDIGLDVLKPSPKDLEHGMELHAESLVFESYGFKPSASVDGDALAALAEEGASDAELQEAREDMGMTRCVTDPAHKQEMLDAFQAAGVDCIFQNAGAEGQAVKRLIKRLAHFTYVTDMLPDVFVRGRTPDDVEAAKAQGKRCLYMSANAVPLSEDWLSPEAELLYIRIFFQLGVRMMHLTYNRRNMIGDGCAEVANGGLSDFGRAVVREMNRQHVIVDCAHSGWQTSLEAAQTSDKPMVASHSGCCAVNEHIRSKPDEVIQAIVDTGGYIGMCCIPGFLGGSGDIHAFLDHIEYAVKKWGADHVAIGTDVGYTSQNAEKAPSRGKRRARWASLWPTDDPMFDPKWNEPRIRQSMAWTNWPLFTVGMVQRGLSDDDIQKVLGGNVMRVARAVLE